MLFASVWMTRRSRTAPGTAAHVTPLLEVDRRPVANGEIGPITAKLKARYFNIIYGRVPEYRQWCTAVPLKQPVSA